MIQAYATAAVSIFLEGLFFLLIGVIVSGFIEAFVPDDFFYRVLPRNSTAAIFAAAFIGLLIPVCECGIVPVISRLIKKGVPVYLTVTLMLASPLINIIVITGTAYAFYGNFWIPLFRTLGGIVIPVIIGFYLKTSYQEAEMLLPSFTDSGQESSCHCSSCGCDSDSKVKPFKENFSHALEHSISDFFKTGGYFIFGILITSILRLNMKDSLLLFINENFLLSNFFMLGLPYVLSVCSYTDAFIARSFSDLFSSSSVLTFLIFGAMFDIKTTLMLGGTFKKRFIFKLIIITALLVLSYSVFSELIIRKAGV